MGFLLDKCKLKKMDDEILSTSHPITCGALHTRLMYYDLKKLTSN